MKDFNWKSVAQPFNDRHLLIIPGNTEETIEFCVKQFIQIGTTSIYERGVFTVALSGGSTPNAIYKKLSQDPYINQIDWTKVLFFWSDERSVSPTDSESNFHNAMEAGLGKLPIPEKHIFRMKGEGDLEENALEYEQEIIRFVPERKFDLLMLGMGEDGHTASLFPYTHGLHTSDRLVVANFVPQKKTWRMTLTYACINSAHHICIYALGKGKADRVAEVMTSPFDPDRLPIQKVGTPNNRAIWILDEEAASKLKDIALET